MSAARDALRNLLDSIHHGRYVMFDDASYGYCKSVVDAGEAVLLVPECEHRIVDIRNPKITSGYMCIECRALFRAGDHGDPPARDQVSAERERCARICDAVNNHDNPMTARDCADVIRKG